MSKETRFRKAASDEQMEMFGEGKPKMSWASVFINGIVYAIIGGLLFYPLIAKGEEPQGEQRLLARIVGCETEAQLKNFLDVLAELGPKTEKPPAVEGCGIYGPPPQIQAMFGGLPAVLYKEASYENAHLKATLLRIELMGKAELTLWSWTSLVWKQKQGQGA